MRTRIITIGKVKNKSLISEIEELKKRINRLEIIELKEIKEPSVGVLKKKECDAISKHLDKSHLNVLLWEHGEQFSTNEFYNRFKKFETPITFIITGAFGPSEELKQKAAMLLSLSKMTFTHEQALYMLVEQIYRFQCYDRGVDYNK